ncbi:tubulin-like doman-containing protein [Rudaeicoccus suwonensis]|uniref:Tubulin-like protein n=1 Tax=Rudaeicoccus suwonensis TaxID=657409 RepID=A0A561E0R4_9MICO|nr:tubulin-like doman-containing protein [Rudaeicoccus suwonensis]TWE09225.1 tubulin-like protein [Rudaeicoccus suwonensis]
MRKFLIVGCGGSGGSTVRLLMDQLQADLRQQFGMTTLPAAWQFVHIDVPVDPDKGPGQLGDIRSMGGHYQSFSSPSNTYTNTALTVESQLGGQGGHAPLLGWAPRNHVRASSIPVTDGAGQYRAVGRMLTLSRVGQLQTLLEAAHSRAMAPDAWGSVPPDQRSSDVLVPIVVASMAGGSGSSMFLDVCRMLGAIPGIDPANIGCFLYTADVFGGLEESARSNVEGNAMAAFPELFAAISRLAADEDRRTFGAFGIHVDKNPHPPFARVLPIGRRVGATGALFGDGSQNSVYRGIARAISGVMLSEQAASQYVAFFLGNPAPVPSSEELARSFGWEIDALALPFGSMGFASLSLGRDRYRHYAAQRLARAAVDHLQRGHEDPTSSLPSLEQLRLLLDNQSRVSLQRIGLPAPGEDIPGWFRSVAFPQGQRQAAARQALTAIEAGVAGTQSAKAREWLDVVRQGIGGRRNDVAAALASSAYQWAEGWASEIEQATCDEFVSATAQFGLPYARALMAHITDVCDAVITQLADAGVNADATDPVAVASDVEAQVSGLGKALVSGSHAIGQLLLTTLQRSSEVRITLEAARLAARVLRSFAQDVLKALAESANDGLRMLTDRTSTSMHQAGLAQLESDIYIDWPDESAVVPMRFDHAQNEVLLTTSADFATHYTEHVGALAEPRDFSRGLQAVRSQVLRGEWETTGTVETHEVLQRIAHWRPEVLDRSAGDGVPTPASKPRYLLLVDTPEIMTRADARVAAKGSPFASFANQSIVEHLSADGLSAIERELRQATFVEKFNEALLLARPVIGVDEQMVQRLHGDSVRYGYSFSELPFRMENPVAKQVLARLEGDPNIVGNSAEYFKSSAVGDETVRKIAIFGTYGKYSPLCYRSLLEPIRDRWSRSGADTQRALWLWKRTRPLSAAIAMSPEDAVRTVAGWYLGRALGLVKGTDGTFAVRTPQAWLSFHDQLASAESRYQGGMDAPASLLMSHAWAIVDCTGDPSLSALAPYVALRNLADASSASSLATVERMTGTRLLHAAFDGEPLTLLGEPLIGGAPSKVMDAPTPEARRDAFLATLSDLRTRILGSGFVEEVDGDYQFRVTSVERLRGGSAEYLGPPLWVEAAPIMLRSLDLLERMAQAPRESTEDGPFAAALAGDDDGF